MSFSGFFPTKLDRSKAGVDINVVCRTPGGPWCSPERIPALAQRPQPGAITWNSPRDPWSVGERGAYGYPAQGVSGGGSIPKSGSQARGQTARPAPEQEGPARRFCGSQSRHAQRARGWLASPGRGRGPEQGWALSAKGGSGARCVGLSSAHLPGPGEDRSLPFPHKIKRIELAGRERKEFHVRGTQVQKP